MIVSCFHEKMITEKEALGRHSSNTCVHRLVSRHNCGKKNDDTFSLVRMCEVSSRTWILPTSTRGHGGLLAKKRNSHKLIKHTQHEPNPSVWALSVRVARYLRISSPLNLPLSVNQSGTNQRERCLWRKEEKKKTPLLWCSSLGWSGGCGPTLSEIG